MFCVCVCGVCVCVCRGCSDLVNHQWQLLSSSFLYLCVLYGYMYVVCQPQETAHQLQQFTELTYHYAVAAMKEEVTFDEAPDHFRGEPRDLPWCLPGIENNPSTTCST